MSAQHLLPPNATRLERALSLATDIAHLASAVDAIRAAKTVPADPVLPWLIWEYGLEELLPYLPEPRRAIAEGVLWQRMRGTPAALRTALGWIAETAVAVEEEPPGGTHWAEYQIAPGRWLEWEEIGRIVAVARLSAPARSRLARLYHGYDLRRVVLDVSRLGDALLSDYSGTRWRDGVTRLSFGRAWRAAIDAADRRAASGSRHLADHVRYGRYADRCLLSVMRFGCRPVPNPTFEHLAGREQAVVLGVRGTARTTPERRFARAQVVLSEQWKLGSTNACTPPRVWVPADTPMRLGDALSAGIGAGRWVPITERFEAGHGSDVPILAAIAAQSCVTLQLDSAVPCGEMFILSAQLSGAVAYRGARATWRTCRWTGRWRRITWRTAVEDIQSHRAKTIVAESTLPVLHHVVSDGAACRSVELVTSAPVAHPGVQALRHGLAPYCGQRWAGRWRPVSWQQARESLQSYHTTTTE